MLDLRRLRLLKEFAGRGTIAATDAARDVYAVARTASVRRPAVAVILSALHDGARHLPSRATPAYGRPRS